MRKKTYERPIMNVCALAGSGGLLVTASVQGTTSIGNGGNASEQQETPIMDVKGEWEDIWD